MDKNILPRDFRDVVIADFALTEVHLRAQLREALADADTWRLIASVALAHMHTLQHANEGLLRALQADRRDERRRRAA